MELPSVWRIGYLVLILFIWSVVGWTAWNSFRYIIGPQVELRIIPPLRSYEVLTKRCIPAEDEMYIYGVMNKTEYPGGAEAEFISREFSTLSYPRRVLPYRPAYKYDRTSEHRSPGFQTFEYILETDDCNERFIAITYHRSPLTGNRLRMRWGPWNPIEGSPM